MSVRPLFKGFALTFILYNCRKRDYNMNAKLKLPLLKVFFQNYVIALIYYYFLNLTRL